MTTLESVIPFVPSREHFDGNNHFNNGAFPAGFACGIRHLLAFAEFNEPVLSKGVGFLGREVRYDYRSPVLSDQEVDIHTKVERYSAGDKFITSQKMMMGRNIMAFAKMICNLNGEPYELGEKFGEARQGEHESRIVLDIREDYVNDGIIEDGFLPSYLENGRLNLVLQTGFDVSALIKRNIIFLVHNAIYRYSGPIRGDKETEVISRYEPYERGLRVGVKQQVIQREDVVAEASLEYIFFNFSISKPEVPPTDILKSAGLID